MKSVVQELYDKYKSDGTFMGFVALNDVNALQKYTGLNRGGTFYRLLKLFGVKKEKKFDRQRFLEEFKDDETLKSLIQEGKRKDILDHLGVYESKEVGRFLEELGYKKIQDKCKIINPVEWDEFTSYFYGFMLGDGNLLRRVGDFRISSTDFDIVEKINDILTEGTRTVHYRKNGNGKEQAHLSLTNREWYGFFSRMGLCPDKSHCVLTLTYPPAEYLPHFVRGLFDSDGCVSCYENGKYLTFQSQLLGTTNYITELSRLISVSGRLSVRISCSTLSELRFSNKENFRLFYEYLYKDASIYMNRKFSKYTEIYNLLK